MEKKTIALIMTFILALGAGFVLVGCDNSGNSSSSSSGSASSSASSSSSSDSASNASSSSANSGSSSAEVTLAPPPKGVKDITTSKQESGGASFTNYRINLTDEINWKSMSKEEKEKIVNYAFSETAKLIERDKVRYYNIIATTPSGEAVFMLDRETFEMVTYKDGEVEYRFPAPTK